MTKKRVTIKNTKKEEYQKKINNIYNNYNNNEILDLVIAAQEELNGVRPGNQNITELIETFHTFIDMYVKFIYTPSYYNLSKTAYKMYALLTPKGEKFNRYKISKLLSIIQNRYEYDEVYNIFVIIFLEKIVKTYKPVGTFIGYFFKYFTYRVTSWIKKELTKNKLESKYVINYNEFESEDLQAEEILDLLSYSLNTTAEDVMPDFITIDDESIFNPKDKIMEMLTPEERNILNLRFNYGYTIAETAEILNMNIRYLVPKIKEIYNKIKKYFEENNIQI